MMSTPGDAPQVEKKGLSKYVSRMKSVLKRSSDGSKRLSFSSRTPVVATSSTTAGPSAPVAASKETKIIPGETKPVPEETKAVETPAEPEVTNEGPEPTKILRSQIDEERARKLSERFKFPIEAKEWTTARADVEAFRIEKPIRMRIHRSCHQCNTTFGGNKTCVSCQHTRCEDCPRYPPKKDKSKKKEKEKEVTPGVGIIEVDNYYALREQVILTRPSRTGGQPLVRKKPMQRVRRTCHECQALFPAGNKICGSCTHVRCADCPRDPAKKKSFPDGYPGDAHSSNPTRPIKYTCHQCHLTYPPIPNPSLPENAHLTPLNCERCGHTRCEECKRAPPRKIDPAPDPEVVRSLEMKLRNLGLEGLETS